MANVKVNTIDIQVQNPLSQLYKNYETPLSAKSALKRTMLFLIIL